MGGGGSHRKYTRKITLGGQISNNDDQCDKINFITDLQNIQPSLKEYDEGDCLKVDLDVLDNIFVEGKYGICGYITSMNAPTLIRCIKKGIDFEAIILKIEKTFCRVKILASK